MVSTQILAKYSARLKECAYNKIQQYFDQNWWKTFLYCEFLFSVHIFNAVLSYRSSSFLSYLCNLEQNQVSNFQWLVNIQTVPWKTPRCHPQFRMGYHTVYCTASDIVARTTKRHSWSPHVLVDPRAHKDFLKKKKVIDELNKYCQILTIGCQTFRILGYRNSTVTSTKMYTPFLIGFNLTIWTICAFRVLNARQWS